MNYFSNILYINRRNVLLVDEMVLGAACELLASYFVYGSIRNDQLYQNAELANFLSLKRKIMGCSDRPAVFQGLSFTESISVKQGKICLEKTLDVQLGYMKEILRFLPEDDVAQIWHLIMESKCNEMAMSRYLLKLLFRYSETVLFPSSEPNQGYSDNRLVCSAIKEYFICPLSCSEFLEYLFSNVCNLQCKALVQLLRSIQSRLSTENLKTFVTQSACLMESTLYSSNCFVYLYPDQVNLSVVLPLYPCDEISYERLDRNVQKKIIDMYEVVYQQYFDLPTKKIEPYIISVERSKRRDFRMLDIFHSIWQHNLLDDIYTRYQLPIPHSNHTTITKY